MLHCVCSTCRQAVEPGQDMFPVRLNPETRRYVWSQVQCAVEELGSEVLRPPTCKHWRYHGRCSYGDKCFYTHDAESYELWKSEGDKTRKRGPRGKLRVRKKSRSFAFRRFLIDTFGSELLQQGTGVLDVAGGKGELSFELVNLNGIPTAVVDPRVSDVQEYRDKWDKGLYTRNRFWQTYSPSYDPERTPQDPNHVHAFFENPLGNHFAHPTEWGLDSRNLRRWWVQCMRRAQCDSGRAGHGFRPGFAVHKKEKEIVPYDPRKEEEEEMHEDDMHEADGIEEMDELCVDDDATDASSVSASDGALPCEDLLLRLLSAVEGSSCIVGLHADQAAEHIVDVALALGKPFAVVPCCVYANTHQHRELDGVKVRSLPQFLEYLQRKSPHIERAELPFEGRNVVLFMRPSGTSWDSDFWQFFWSKPGTCEVSKAFAFSFLWPCIQPQFGKSETTKWAKNLGLWSGV